MTVKEVLNQIEEIKQNNNSPLTIGELLSKLNNFEDCQEITLSNGTYLDGDWGSYRGNYECLYIGYDEMDTNQNLVFDLKDLLEEALRIGSIMDDYKVGNFPINLNTEVYLARYGELGEMVVDLREINGEIILITKDY
jgi:hypothetical protein